MEEQLHAVPLGRDGGAAFPGTFGIGTEQRNEEV